MTSLPPSGPGPGDSLANVPLPRCPHCGGSGVLRMSEQRFRTCLDCLGQGHEPRFEPQPRLQDAIQPDVIQPWSQEINAGAVSSGSR